MSKTSDPKKEIDQIVSNMWHNQDYAREYLCKTHSILYLTYLYNLTLYPPDCDERKAASIICNLLRWLIEPPEHTVVVSKRRPLPTFDK